MRHMGKVDEVDEAGVLARLSRPDAGRLLGSDVDVDDLRCHATEIRDNRNVLAAMLRNAYSRLARFARKQSTWRTRSMLDRQIEPATGGSPRWQIIGADDVSATWRERPLTACSGILSKLAQVTNLPAGKGVRFRPEHVRIEWNS